MAKIEVKDLQLSESDLVDVDVNSVKIFGGKCEVYAPQANGGYIYLTGGA
ncbi:MAG: hypothetical protein F6K65_36645, partial [Moorea sp. SIO3C2]|nr:hypothetical protein [Moorena sp. SIO3C2]